ncbi:MAG: hypothetical protein VX938_08760, partial [Myxococcota bacterium]|nr:hypothetical protein [Myxococcota bacterium]
GTRLGAAWAGEDATLRRNLWLSLVPQGGASMGFVAMAAVALPGLGRPLAEVVGAILVLNLFLGPVGLKIALHRSGALKRPDEEEVDPIPEGAEEAPVPEEVDADEQDSAPDPLQGLVPPEDPDLEAAWLETTEQLQEIRRSVQEQAVTPRLERVGKVLRSTAGQARHSLQVASEACGREETAEGLRSVLRAHRGHLADQVQKALIDLRPPASAEDVPMVVHLVSQMADDLVALAPAEITAMETERHLTGVSTEPPWTRMGKTLKRGLRGTERVFGRPASIRQVPYRRIVRRVVTGELVAELDGMELLVGRAEFRVLRRMETLLRRADEALVDGLAEVEAGRSPEELKAWLQERQLDLREASQQALEDESLLEEEPVRRLSDAMARSLEQLTVLSDDAGTFVVGEGRLRFASVAPGARAAAATAGDVRDGWKDKQQALVDRMVLWTRLIKLQQRLRELAFHEALGPARRMHGRLGELLRDAQSRVAAAARAPGATDANRRRPSPT